MSKFSRERCRLFMAWNVHRVVFLPILFPGYFCSFEACVVYIVSGGWNQSSTVCFYVIFKLLCQWIDVIMNAGEFFKPQTLVLFHRSINDRKSPQISRTLLNIQANFINLMVGMVSILLWICYSYGHFSYLFGLFQAYQLQFVTPPTSCSTVFPLVLWQVPM